MGYKNGRFQICNSVVCNTAIKQVFLFQLIHKNIHQSYKMDLVLGFSQEGKKTLSHKHRTAVL